MTKGRLLHQVDAWMVQTILAARHLARLYRRLGDDKQAAAALESLSPAEAHVRKWRIQVPRDGLSLDQLGEMEAEALAWEHLLEGQAGVCAFHAVIEAGKVRGSRKPTERGYLRALKGLHTAFPAGVAEACHGRAIRRVSTMCADLFIQDLGEEGTPQERERLHRTIQDGILQTFLPEA